MENSLLISSEIYRICSLITKINILKTTLNKIFKNDDFLLIVDVN